MKPINLETIAQTVAAGPFDATWDSLKQYAIPGPEQRMLREIGAWLAINGAAIYSWKLKVTDHASIT